ncbi:squalene/phytoene synthase family protein [Magnetospira sp. QH-2]|uniref:phytoene/squalene synthase family protein n=1 Tax=Magnetospira sp. (strain QH-2) TaxID=1288970 RepID=UPI0003E8143F|nr:squalene/phytoene synthase family protein [Magnetospira sp. QH-2]CCQ74330.1 putative Squalene/phytoene synthase [Magnetospira sp. QH-2]
MEDYCLTQVRSQDPDRFYCALFLPAEPRRAVMALLAFNLEIAGIRERVSEPMLGRIRLQWWREALEALDQGQRRDHELLIELAALREQGIWPLKHLQDLIDARERDMESDPCADLNALEAYARETSTPLARAALTILGIDRDETREAVEKVALAWALIGLVRAVPFHRSMGRRLLPLPDPPAGDSAVVVGVTVRARLHLNRARALRKQVAKAAHPLLLPALLVDDHLATLQGAGYDPENPALMRKGRKRLSLLLHGWLGRY